MLDKITNGDLKVALIGLGYVGLPLAVEFGRKFDTVGFDVKPSRLEMLKRGVDTTCEVSAADLEAAVKLKYSGNPEDLRDRDVFIVTVPTPVDKHNSPDLTPLIRASETVGRAMRPGSLVIYESTVYPGCTEEQCVPVLEKFSSLKFNRDFFCGYSPERINPGDKEHTLTKILKITSGSTPEAAGIVDAVYNSILHRGTYKASSIKVAEAAKVIENSQRDLNIAFVNELAKIFHLIGIDTREVLAAAGTKWNFLPFTPGLVGGHCIGVDPYYLTYKAQELGYLPEVILAGRRINDDMGRYIATEVIKLMIGRNIMIKGAKVLVLGVTFKGNCPDVRNSKAIDLIRALREFGCAVDIWDPRADAAEIKAEYNLDMLPESPCGSLAAYHGIVLAVAHDEFKSFDFSSFDRSGTVVYDVQGILPKAIVDARL